MGVEVVYNEKEDIRSCCSERVGVEEKQPDENAGDHRLKNP
jgi:hypothetical protein